jgi:hypothetical protein
MDPVPNAPRSQVIHFLRSKSGANITGLNVAPRLELTVMGIRFFDFEKAASGIEGRKGVEGLAVVVGQTLLVSSASI